MVVRKRKKCRTQRGSRSHGWGVIRDHKGSGMKGGRGNAGVFSHRWIQVIKQAKLERRKNITGRYGFKRPQSYQKKYGTINVSHLSESIDTLVKLGKAKVEGEKYLINLSEVGITKLLAQGQIVRKIDITVEKATEKAISKVTEAGGTVKLLER